MIEAFCSVHSQVVGSSNAGFFLVGTMLYPERGRNFEGRVWQSSELQHWQEQLRRAYLDDAAQGLHARPHQEAPAGEHAVTSPLSRHTGTADVSYRQQPKGQTAPGGSRGCPSERSGASPRGRSRPTCVLSLDLFESRVRLDSLQPEVQHRGAGRHQRVLPKRVSSAAPAMSTRRDGARVTDGVQAGRAGHSELLVYSVRRPGALRPQDQETRQRVCAAKMQPATRPGAPGVCARTPELACGSNTSFPQPPAALEQLPSHRASPLTVADDRRVRPGEDSEAGSTGRPDADEQGRRHRVDVPFIRAPESAQSASLTSCGWACPAAPEVPLAFTRELVRSYAIHSVGSVDDPPQQRRINVFQLLSNPLMEELEHFLSERECDAFIQLANQCGWDASMTFIGEMDGHPSEYRQVRSSSRTSYRSLLDGEHGVVLQLKERLAAILSVSSARIEPLTVVRYTPDQHFKLHYDGHFRSASLILYLNDVEAGGETEFPALGIAVIPKKGYAVHWHNCLADGEPDLRTLHAGAPVLRGVKYCIPVFIRSAAFDPPTSVRQPVRQA